MKILLIGGTGRISMSITDRLIKEGHEVWLFNRGSKRVEGAMLLQGDINDEEKAASLLKNLYFDSITNFINYRPDDIKRDIRLFTDKTNQYIFISTASAYQKPPVYHIITESTPLYNPFWDYSRQKIACEDVLINEYRNNNFPITIVRPSHTYENTSLPVAIHGGSPWQVAKRMLENKPVIVPGDGLTLWTLTHSIDFAKGFAGLIGNIRTIGEAYHITSDECLTWNTIYNEIGNALGVKAKLCHIPSDYIAKKNPKFAGSLLGDKSNNAIFDNSKIKRVVPNFICDIPFRQGVKSTINHLLEHKSLQKEDLEFDKFTEEITGGFL